MSSWKFYLGLTLLFILTQGVYAMLEMAVVSLNRVRLQYWVGLGKRRAKWLSYLVDRPTLLFGATLIGVNTSLQVGSECSRRFYETVGLSPDWAPLSQIFLVIVFAELAPMFAGRRYAEHAAMLGAPLLFFTSWLVRPVIWLFDGMCRAVNALIGSSKRKRPYLSREDVLHLFEQRMEEQYPAKGVDAIASNLLALRDKVAKDLMSPMDKVKMVPSFCSVGEIRTLLSDSYTPFLPIYEWDPRLVTGMIYPRDLLRLTEERRIGEYARSAWFIAQEGPILSILKQFRQNNQSLAVVLNDAGHAVGFLSLDDIVDSIFGRSDEWESLADVAPRTHHIIVDRTFSGAMLIKDFNRKFHVHLASKGVDTLEKLVEKELGHPPEKGESVHVDQFELTVEDIPLIGPKTIAVRTVF